MPRKSKKIKRKPRKTRKSQKTKKSQRKANSPGPGPKGVLDPVLILLFLIVFIYKYRAPPQGPPPAEDAPFISHPPPIYLPSIGVRRCSSPLGSAPEAPPKWLLLPPVLELLPSGICDFGASFLHFWAHVLELLPSSICDFGAHFFILGAHVLELLPSRICDFGAPFFAFFGTCFGAPPP